MRYARGGAWAVKSLAVATLAIASGTTGVHAAQAAETVDLVVNVGQPAGPVPVGKAYEYSVTVYNAGPSTATGVVLQGSITGAMSKLLTATPIAVPDLAPRARSTVVVEAVANNFGPMKFTAVATSKQTDLEVLNNVAGVSTQAQYETVVTVTSSKASPVYGQPVTFTVARYTKYYRPDGSSYTLLSGPTGLGLVIDGQPVTVTTGKQVATYTTAALRAGSHTLTGTWSSAGSIAYMPGSASKPQKVVQASATVKIDLPASPRVGPMPITIRASAVAPSTAIPTGTVTLRWANGTEPTRTAGLVDGRALVTVYNYLRGPRTLTVIFQDQNGNFAPTLSDVTYWVS